MKKIFTFLFVAIISLTFVCGCDSKKDETTEEKTDTKEETRKDDNKKKEETIGLNKDSLSCKAADEKSEFEIDFKDSKVTKVIYKEQVESKEEAESYVSLFNSLGEDGLEAASEGDIVILTYNESYIIGSEFDNVTKEDLKKEIEAEGYTCK
jgi:hypothetical protein